MKRLSLLAFLLVFAVLFTATPLSAVADLPLYSEEEVFLSQNENGFGYHGDQIIGYNGVGEETLTFPSVLGDTAMRTVSAKTTQFFARTYPEITRLILPEGVTSVGPLSLHQLPNLQEIVLPRSLRHVGEGAFLGAVGPCDLVMPNVSRIDAQYRPPVEPTVTLHGYRGSYVERFAAYHELPFEAIAHAPSSGDVNADGFCNSTDARLLLQYATEKMPLPADLLPFADVDSDGVVTSTDARLVLQHAVEQITLPRVTVPIRLAEPVYIHPNATAEVRLWYTETDSPYQEGAVVNPSALIAAANRLVANSYETYSALFHSHYTVRIEFTNPDGTRFVLQNLHTYGWAVGEVWGGIGNRKDSTLLKAVLDALPKK